MPDKNIQAETRTSLAKKYNVKYETFCEWVQVNPVLKKVYKPYLDNDKRVLPPEVVKKTFEILGEP